MQRRHYLGLLGAGATLAIAGCAEDDPDVEGANGDDDDDGSEQAGTGNDDGKEESEQNVFEFGEAVEFFTDDEQLTFRPHSARLANTLLFQRSERILSELPDDELFLLMDVEMENVGDEEVWVPGDIDFVIDGSDYDPVFLTDQVDDPYEELEDLRPGATATRTLAFSIPQTDSEGSLFAEFGSIETITAEWTLDLSTIGQDTIDFGDNSIGEAITVEAGDIGYEFEISSVESTESYTYESALGEEEESASDGMEWLFVDIRAENTGEATVSVPSQFDIRVLADNQQFESEFYFGDDDTYEGGDLSAGIVEESFLLFEVPADASDIVIEVELTRELDGTWNV